MIKLAIRNHALKYSSIKQKDRNNRLSALERKLKQIEERFYSQSIFNSDEQTVLDIKKGIVPRDSRI